MDRHLDRWRLSEKRWKEQVNRLRDFGAERVKYMRFHLSEFFETGELVSHAVEIDLKGKSIHKISAVFEKYVHPLAGQIMINEISCNNKKTGDWVEVYNASKETINLKDWYFTDKKRYFNIPNAKIRPKSYLIISEDSIAFREHFFTIGLLLPFER